MQSNVISRIWVNLAIPQVVLGVVAYTLMISHNSNVTAALNFALVVASIVAWVYLIIAIFHNNKVGVAIATASSAAALAFFCAVGHAIGFTIFFFIIAVLMAKLAGKIVEKG